MQNIQAQAKMVVALTMNNHNDKKTTTTENITIMGLRTS